MSEDLVHVKGLSELSKFLQQLPEKMRANVMRGALRAGAKEIEAQAKALVPVDSGRLRDSIRVTTKRMDGGVMAIVRAGGRSGKKTVLQAKSGRQFAGHAVAYYAQWVEFGTAAHQIAATDAKHPVFFGGMFAQKIDHPGAKPHPFMRPALDSRAQAAVVAAAEYIKKRLADKHGLDTADVEIA